MFNINLSKKTFCHFASKIMLCRPTNFHFNPNTAQDNLFMNKMDQVDEKKSALNEFDDMVANLRANKIECDVEDQLHSEAFDSVFPNNWFSTLRNDKVPEGVLVIYPMKAVNRRLEKNPFLVDKWQASYKKFIDISYLEQQGEYLEGTGVLIFDNYIRSIYCSMSERATAKALKVFEEEFSKVSGFPYKVVKFKASDRTSRPIYHTNVMLSILPKHAVVCLDSVRDKGERKNLVDNLERNKQIIDVSFKEMEGFCCNIINVKNKDSENCVILSETARNSFRKESLEVLEKNYKLVSSRINVIETVGGGSARCMVGELF